MVELSGAWRTMVPASAERKNGDRLDAKIIAGQIPEWASAECWNGCRRDADSRYDLCSTRSAVPHHSVLPHTELPLSKTMRQPSGATRRQIELKRPTTLPAGSRTGPVLSARSPESSTCTWSGSQENGASFPSKNGFHCAATADFPRTDESPEKKIASSAR